MNKINVVGLYIPNRDRELLVVHRNTPTRNWWELIGGICLPHERPIDTAERKAETEGAISVRAVKRLYTFDFPHNGKDYSQEVWWADIEGGDPYARDEDHDDIDWMDLRTLRQRDDLSPGLRELTKLAVNVPEIFVRQ